LSASSGHGFSLTQGDGGSASITNGATPDAEGLYSGTVVVTGTPTNASTELVWWLVNNERIDCGNTLTLTMDGSKSVQPVFGLSVTSGGDSGTGTLRWAVENIPAGSGEARTLTIGVKVPEVQLDSVISARTSYIIEAKDFGAVIRPRSSWSGTNSLLYFPTASGYVYPNVTARGIHFKDTQYGVISVSGGTSSSDINYSTFTAYNCIFSGNQGRPVSASGNGNVYLYNCTFYNNNVGSGTALLNKSYVQYRWYSTSPWSYTHGSYYIYNCLFYGNTASTMFYYPTSTPTPNELVSYSAAYVYGNVADGWAVNGNITNYLTASNNKTLSELGINGVPFDTTTFRPVSSALSGIGAVEY
jgi:hypothetical protein